MKAPLLLAMLLPGIAAASPVFEAQNVLIRTFGSRAAAIKLRLAPGPRGDGKDYFQVKASGGNVSVSGSSGVALTRGAYEYLKRTCGALVTWEGTRIQWPKTLPDWDQSTVIEHQYRHYFNVCTFGYTTAFWDWNRWQKEIDWMALHGINMPLAMTGQEAAWQDVWRAQGVPDEDIRAFFSGPAFLPWHRMGNLNGWGGPLPQSWIDGQAKLQQKILDREHALGMTPVVPGFSGFVPPTWKGSETMLSSGWCGFEPTVIVRPEDPKFREIGAAYVRSYQKRFGTSHLYLADVFNEMHPSTNDPVALGKMSRAIYEAIRAGDPQGKWLMQGWLFYNESDFWKTAQVEGLLSGVPSDDMILLDLSAEQVEIWRRHEAFRKKPWIWNVLHNFGQNTGLFGRPESYVNKWKAALADPEHGRMSGMGMTPEGIEQNALIYEMVCDMMWSSGDLEYATWLKDYCVRRYGVDMSSTWNAIFNSPLTGAWNHPLYVTRPSAGAIGEPDESAQSLILVAKEFASQASKMDGNKLYERDLVDITKVALGQVSSVLAYQAEQDPRRQQAFMDLLDEIDQLVNTQPQHQLANWVRMARSWGKNAAERDLMEKNAKLQVTVWGGPILYDYAAKEWSGLTGEFYKERWKRFFDEQAGGPSADLPRWEKQWAETAGTGMARIPKRDGVAFARELINKYSNLEVPKVDRGIAVGKRAFDSGHTETGGSPAIAVDGRASGSFWAASPAPRWWAVDLGSPTPLHRIVLFPYVDGTRYYQYRIEISDDGTAWREVIDASKNIEPSSRKGYAHEMGGVTARFVRVVMLKNSANIGVHLHEVRIF